MRELWVAIVLTSGAKIYALVVSVAIVVITARFLGPEGRGQVAVITNWVSAFCILSHLSLGQVALHRAATAQDDSWLREGAPVLIAWTFVASLAGWLLAGLLWSTTDGRIFGAIQGGMIVLGFLGLPFMIWEQYGTQLLMAVNRLGVANRFQMIGRTVALLGVLASMWQGRGVGAVIVSTTMGQAVLALGGTRSILRAIELRLSLAALRSYLKSGLQLHFNAIGTFLFASADVLILNYYAGARETGYYQLGLQLIATMMVVPQAASSVLYAKVAAVGADRAWSEQKRILLYSLALMVVAIIIAMAMAEWAIVLLAGDEFEPSVGVFRWQLLSLVGMSLSAVMAPQWIGRGFFKLASGITMLLGAVHVAVTFWLVPTHGMFGAAWANVITYGVAIVGNGTFAIWCNRRAQRTLAVGERT